MVDQSKSGIPLYCTSWKAMETRAYLLAQRSFMHSYLTKVLHPNKFVQAILVVPLGILLLGEKSNDTFTSTVTPDTYLLSFYSSSSAYCGSE